MQHTACGRGARPALEGVTQIPFGRHSFFRHARLVRPMTARLAILAAFVLVPLAVPSVLAVDPTIVTIGSTPVSCGAYNSIYYNENGTPIRFAWADIDTSSGTYGDYVVHWTARSTWTYGGFPEWTPPYEFSTDHYI